MKISQIVKSLNKNLSQLAILKRRGRRREERNAVRSKKIMEI